MMSSDKRTPISRARHKIEKRRKSRRAHHRRLRLESLERRDLLTMFVVDTAADVMDADDGVTSIREALRYANLGYGSDEIRFDFALEGETIRLGGTPLNVLDNLTIRGPGSEGIAISGSDLSSVLVVQANRSLTIDNLTIRDGVDSGIANFGTLSASNSLITQNQGSTGGGIRNSGSLSLTHSIVSNNIAGSGGGISSSGSASIRNSIVTGNIGYDADRIIENPGNLPIPYFGFARGGGIKVSQGSLSLVESTVSNNGINKGAGTGIYVDADASLQVSGATISGNSVRESSQVYTSPGAVFTLGTVTFIDSTISGNGVGLHVRGGETIARHVTITDNGTGVWKADATSSLSLFNSIIAGNTYDDFLASGYSVIGVSNLVGNRGGSGGMINGINGNWVGYDAYLGPLQNNLGPTATHAPLPGSLAIDHGDPAYSDSHDQRGRYRPQGASVDIGAFELKDPVHLVIPATAGDDVIAIDHFEGATTLTKNGVKTEYADVELLSISIQPGNGADTIRLNSTPPMPLTVLAGEGDDKIYVGDGDYSTNIMGPITIHAGTGQDELIIDDSDAQAGVTVSGSFPRLLFDGVQEHYTIDSQSFSKLRTQGPLDGQTEDVVGALLVFDSVGEIELHSAGTTGYEFEDLPGSVTNIFGVANDTNVTVNGNGGNDHFDIGGGDFDTNIRGDVRINGGSGINALMIDDETDGGADDYTFSAEGNVGTFTKNSGSLKVSTLRFKDLDSVELEGNDSNNLIHVDRMLSTTDLTLNGNDGIDEFHISVVGQVSDVQINGGRPFSSPGDSLYVTGNGLLDATYTPHLNDPRAGTIVMSSALSSGAIRNTISFTGLEPVNIDVFDTVTMVTPRSQDLISVSNQAEGWSMIGGISGHPAQMVPFESLSFRDVKNVVLDTATRDLIGFSYPPGPNAIIYPPVPHDIVNIFAGALDARGLESFDIVTGLGYNTVDDWSSDAGTWQPAGLNVDGSGGRTDVTVYGDYEHADAEQLSGRRAGVTGFDESENPIKVVGVDRVELLVFPLPIESLTAIGRDVNRIFSGMTDLTIAGEDLTALRFTPQSIDSELIVVANGDSVVEFRSSPFVIDEISAGPQPEPPSSPDNITFRVSEAFAAAHPSVDVNGYGPEDTLTVESFMATDGVTSRPTNFSVTSGPFVFVEVLVMGDPLKRFDLQLETDDPMGAGPSLRFLGDFSVENTFKLTSWDFIDPLMLMPLPVELEGRFSTATALGSLDDERVTFGTMSDGRQTIDLVNSHDVGRDVHLTTGPGVFVDLEGGGGFDEFQGEYRDPDSLGLNANLSGFETLAMIPAPDVLPSELTGSVMQEITPTTGSFSYGDTFISHDGDVRDFRSDAHSVELSVTVNPWEQPFDRPLTYDAGYLGSEGKFFFDKVKSDSKIDVNIRHKGVHIDTTIVQIANSEIDELNVNIDGGSGTHQVMIHEVNNQFNKRTTKLALEGTSKVIVVRSNDGQDPSSSDEISMTAKGETKLLVKDRGDASGEVLANELKVANPEWGSDIEALESKLDQTLYRKQGVKTKTGPAKRVKYIGVESDADIYVANDDPEPTELMVWNVNGTTKLVAQGNVVEVDPTLIGTGIPSTGDLQVFAVTNTLDQGAGSLRAAIEATNAWTGTGLAVIAYAIPTTDPGFVDVDSHLPGGDAAGDAFVISPLTVLPALTRGNTVINGQSQHNLTGDTNPFGPEVVLDGSLLGDGTTALHLTSDNNQIHGLNIQGFTSETDEIILQVGILLDGDGNLVTGNFIGTNAVGTEAKANRAGVLIRNSSNNTIGGPSPNARNVISSNTVMGIQLQGTSNDNTIQGNYIGTDANGLAALGNGKMGIDVLVHSSRNLIGTDGDGVNDQHEGNLISGNTQYGIEIRGLNSGAPTDNIIAGNRIGVDVTGNTGLGNGSGIHVWGGSGTRIGTNADGISDVHERNVISDNHDWEGTQGNGGWGIFLRQSSDTIIAGNRIGTGADGITPLGNTLAGIGSNDSPRTVIGGSVAAQRNIIADNGRYGMVHTRSNDGVIAGNFIGVAADGVTPLGNAQHGVLINDGANNIIGTDGDGLGDILERNVVSANGGDGIVLRYLNDASPVDNTIAGNFIGVGADGTTPLGNAQNGVMLKDASNNTIGGMTPAERNVISGNGGTGVLLSASNNNIIAGNYIGTDSSGLVKVPNVDGVVVTNAATGNRIGGTSAAERNLISGNDTHGVYIVGPNAANNVVVGNHIGIAADGVTQLSNKFGVLVQGAGGGTQALGAPGNRIGGTSPAERNVISGNTQVNVFLSKTLGTTVQGNYIGTDVSGTARVNARLNKPGIKVFDDRDSVIGGSEPGAGNLISANGFGIMLDGRWLPGGSERTRIQGNRIGTNPDGTMAVPNRYGVYVNGHVGSDGIAHEIIDVLIGGDAPGEGNLISGSINQGIVVVGPGSKNVVIHGNKIGTDITGQNAIGNGVGVLIEDASGVMIGGTQPGARNLISGNTGNGITVNGAVSETKSEAFDYSHVSALDGWTEFGSRENRDSFGFSQTNHTNLSEGLGWEAGGILARASTSLGETTAIPISYYADTRLGGRFTLDNSVHADGELAVIDSDQWDNNVHIGYFDRSDAESNQRRNVLGLVILEPSARLGSEGIRTAAYMLLSSGPEIIGNWVDAPTGLDFNVPYTWQYNYNPNGGSHGAGELVVEIFAEGVSVGTSRIDLTLAQRSVGAAFDAFGLRTGGNPPKSNSPNTVSLYVDNVTYSRPVGNTIQGNYIGTTADGSSALPNRHGVELYLATDNLIVGNTISGNEERGVYLSGPTSPGNTFVDNVIGLSADGASSVGNGTGVLIIGAPDNVFRSNVISGNVGTAIDIRGSNATGNTIRENSIHDNGGLGIDLGGDGVTLNDAGDADVGPNLLQNYPVLHAVAAGSATQVFGILDSTANSVHTLDFYASDELDESGYGEGERWLDSIDVTTDAAGHADFVAILSATTSGGDFITSTATDASGNTSEFSGGFIATGWTLDRPVRELVIGGGIFDDTVGITQGSIIVTVNGVTFTFEDDGEARVVVNLLSGDDTLISAITNDTVAFGGKGDDFLQLGSGNDEAFGGPGNDTLLLGAGDDRGDGGSGDDHIDGEAGRDEVSAGDGVDVIVVDADDDLGTFVFEIVAPISLTDDSVVVRGQTLSLNTEYPDPTSSVSWDFGDGSDASGSRASHVFTDVGDYYVQVTIVDASGNTTSIGRDLPVTVTALQVDPQNADETALAVGGTTGRDRIRVSKRGRRHGLDVRLNRDRLDVETPSGHLLVYAQDGNDVILVSGSVSLPSMIDAGAGNDFVVAGAGDDIVLGRAGNDVLIGGRGRDVLVGGTGRDMIIGGLGGDLLIAGQVSFADEQTSLLNIMSEWRSDRSYASRVANISGVGSGPSLNGNHFLKTSGAEATVFDDDAIDALFGGGGLDWLLFGEGEDFGVNRVAGAIASESLKVG